MAQEIGESREKWGWDVMRQAEDFANAMKSEDKPFYIIYACKEDRGMSKQLGRHAFKQAFRAYFTKPPVMIGTLVWYVDHPKGEFRFVPELSTPPDVPLDENLLSTKSADYSERVASQGQKANVLIS